MIWLIILIAFPLVEVVLLIKVGGWIGFWPTLAIVVGTLALGAFIAGRSGLASAMRLRTAMASGRPPVAAMLEGALLAVAGILLVTPGLIADAAGLLLLLPPVRALVARLLLRNMTVVGDIHVERTVYGGRSGPGEAPGGGPVIEGEFERLEERTMPPRRPESEGRKPE